MREQFLDIQGDGKLITLTNKITLDPILEQTYLDRTYNPTGWTIEKTMKKICSIPIDMLKNDPDGIIFMECGNGSIESKIALKRFLEKHPEFKCSNSKL